MSDAETETGPPRPDPEPEPRPPSDRAPKPAPEAPRDPAPPEGDEPAPPEGDEPAPPEGDEPAPPEGNELDRIRLLPLLMWILGGLVVAGLATSLLVEWVGVRGTDPILALLGFATIYGFVGAWLVTSFARAEVRVDKLLGPAPRSKSLRRAIASAVASWLIAGAAYALVYVHLAPQPVPLGATDPAPPPGSDYPDLAHALAVLVAIVLVPIVEEFLFRGVLLHRWSHRFGRAGAVFYTSLLFAAIHGEMIGRFLLGFLLAKSYLKTRSLHIPIFCHMLFNGIALVGGFYEIRPGADNLDAIGHLFEEQPWIGLGFLVIGVPLVVHLLRDLETPPDGPLPYEAPGKGEREKDREG